jgi:hypothetical protein
MAQNKHDTSFLSLFDRKSLDGWKMAGKGKFNILQGENVLQTEGGMGLLWYYRKKFKDFTFELEWKASSMKDNLSIYQISKSKK